MADHPVFATDSHEPRFAFESKDASFEAIADGLRLQWRCQSPRNSLEDPEEAKFNGFIVRPTTLVIAVMPIWGFGGASSWVPLFPQAESGVLRVSAALRVEDWLKNEAAFPDRPWFDGGETAGFRMYHVAFNQEPGEHYGYAVIEPKWFEVHK